MSSFLKSASKQVTDVRNFLRETAGGNGIKYVAEKGAKHQIYIPFTSTMVVDEATGAQVTTKSIIALMGKVHEWTTQDGKFKAVTCLEGVIRQDENGNYINDGSCPICDRVRDGWDIYNYRKELEEMNCKLTGDQRKQHLETTFASYRDERKAKEVRNYMYILVVKFRLNESGAPILGDNNLPEYELKVMKLSASRVEKLQQQLANTGIDLADSELILDYPSVDDKRLLVSQSTTSPVFAQNRLTAKYPELINKINADVAKFEWDGIEQAFPEWKGMTTVEAKLTMDNSFEKWDEYKQQKLSNPTAKYMEYIVETPTATPSIGGENIGAQGVPVIPTMSAVGGAPIPSIPVVPTVPQAAPAVAPVAPQVAPQVAPAVTPVAAPVAPQVPVADANAVFAGNGATAPTVQI